MLTLSSGSASVGLSPFEYDASSPATLVLTQLAHHLLRGMALSRHRGRPPILRESDPQLTSSKQGPLSGAPRHAGKVLEQRAGWPPAELVADDHAATAATSGIQIAVLPRVQAVGVTLAQDIESLMDVNPAD